MKQILCMRKVNTFQGILKIAQISLKEFALSLSKYIDVYEVLDNYNTQSLKGFIVERLWDLVIKFGCCNKFSNNEYEHLDGNINNGEINVVKSIKKYIESNLLISGNTSGKSDITLRKKTTGEYILITSKYPKDNTKDKQIDYFDVQGIIAVIHHLQDIIKKHKIYIIVHDKQQVLSIASRSQSEYISKYFIEENILDIRDLNRCFILLKQKLESVSYDDIETLYVKQPYLQNYFHQKLVIEKTKRLALQGHKNVLWACKCRSGKTYMLGGYILNESVRHSSYNVLIITPVISTIEQFTDDLFYKYADFKSFNVYHIKNGEQLKSLNININSKNIIILSKQLLDKKNVELLRKCKFNLVAFDENHFGGTTEYAEQTLNNYCHSQTMCIYMTATYSKTITKWNIPNECHIQWDIEDEVWCKTGDFDKLIDKHGEQEFYSVLQELTESGEDIGDVFTSYSRYPDMHFLTTMFDQHRYDVIKANIKDTVYGFSMETLFSLNEEQTEFLFPNDVQTFLGYISGSNKIKDFPQGDKSVFSRIRNISMQKQNRTILTNDKFTTQLWFLPYAQGLHIDKLSKCLKRKMMNDNVLSQFELLLLNSKEVNSKDVKQMITRTEETAKQNNKQGLIILVAKQCSLGVSLPLCDVVFLLNNSSSSDEIFQMMYRSMTDAIGKTCGFVVDCNPCRVLNTLLDYDINKQDLNDEDKITYMVKRNIINIDSDMFVSKEQQEEQLKDKLLDVWKNNPTHRLKTLLHRIENQVIELNETDQKEVNKAFIKSHNGDNVNISISMTGQQLPSGKQKTPCNNSSKHQQNEDEDNDTEENISLTKDVLPFVIPLSCILTMEDNNYDFIDMLQTIEQNPKMLDIFNDQSYKWWNKKNIIKLIEMIVVRYINKSSTIYNIAIQFKMSIQSLIDKPKELLELIDSCLKPKQKEKQDNGEVFTPMSLVNEMLDNLDSDYQKENNKSIFTEKDFKWGDIVGSGMGNFSVAVYLRLMEGLKEQIPDDSERKKHILENMLYMAELTKKNVFICRQVFDINNEYKLNLYEGDALLLDTKQEWGVEKFDVILGNPPYNKGGIRSHTGKQLGTKNETVWPKFVDKSLKLLKDDGYLALIHPLSWLKKSHSLHNTLLEKHIVWLKLWDNSCSKQNINADIPISLYLLHNKINNNTQETRLECQLKRRALQSCLTTYLNSKYSIPLAYHNIFNKLIAFIEAHNLQLEYSTKTIKSSGTKTKLPNDYTMEDLWAVDTYTIKDGVMVKKATEQHQDASKRKLIIANKASFTGAFIDDGKLSLTGNHKFYILGENLELLNNLLQFKITNIICHFSKYGQDFLDSEAFMFIPDIRKLGFDDITEHEFYELVGLTEDEIKQINEL